MGRTEDARVHFEQAVAADPDFAMAHLNLAFTTFAESVMEGVMKRLETARKLVEAHPSNTRALMILASAQLSMGDTDEARSAIAQRNPLLRAQAETVGTASARMNTRATIVLTDGMLAAREGDYELAVQKADEAKKILEAESGPDRYQPVHELLGIVSLEQGSYVEAVEHFEKAGRDNLYANYHHAMALEEAGRTEEAMRLYEKVANWNFNNAAVALVRSSARGKTKG